MCPYPFGIDVFFQGPAPGPGKPQKPKYTKTYSHMDL